ncbi:glycosyltransferase family 4 protein [Cognatishimia sp.]|uniref:glycosyltransferase family 4 protein n=1 Tax=Cognatishimia sp. TaxID=2211648 RepID=UPI0035193189
MRIAQIFSHSGVNGVTTSGRMILQGLLARGHALTVFHRPNAWFVDKDYDGDITFHEVDMGVRLLNYKEITRVQSICADQGVEILHSHGDVASRVTSHIRVFGKLPTVATRHNMSFHPHWRFQNAVIAPSQATADDLRRQHLVARKRLHVVPNFLLEQSRFQRSESTRGEMRKSLGIPSNAFVLLSVGSVETRKNQSAAPALIKALEDMGVLAHLILVGGHAGDEATKVETEAERLGVQSRLHIIGHSTEVPVFLQCSDAFLSTSKAEQASIALLEAMAAGLPTYCTDTGSAKEIIRNGQTGYLLDLANSKPALQDMARLAASPDALSKASVAARNHFEQSFSAAAILPQLERLYQQLAHG